MRTVFLVIALAVIPWIANKLGAPAWGTALAALPLLLFLIVMNWSEDDPEENMLGSASEPVRKWLLPLLGVGALAFGIAAASLKGTSSLLSIFGWVLPIGLVVLLIGIFKFFKK